MKYILAFVAALVMTGSLCAFDLTRAVIVSEPSATPAEANAARELQTYLEKLSGRTPEIVPEPKGDMCIYVGQTPMAKALVPDFDWDSLRDDGILIKSSPDSLVLAGDRPRGTLYAVYSFLQDFLGIRFFSAHLETLPEKPRLNLSDNIFHTYVPPFFCREAYYGMNHINPQTAVKMRNNGTNTPLGEEWGGNHSLIGFGHTFGSILLRSEDYFEKHPEWYALVDGVRQPTQPCLSNPEVQEQLAANVLAELAKHENPKMISVSQNDNTGYCRCESCTALAEKFGSQSGLLIWTLNNIYEKIKDKYPDVLLETFAYQYTVEPPKNIKPCPNAAVMLCDIENNFAEPIAEASGNGPYSFIANCRLFNYGDRQTVNRDFLRNLEGWSSICKNLFIWNYTANFSSYYIMHPVLGNFGSDIRTFRKNNAVYVFEQGDIYNATSNFSPLKNYVLSQLMWNPDLDEKELIRDFTDAYYGKGAGYVRQILSRCEEIINNKHIFLSLYSYDLSWMSKEEMADIFRLWCMALSAVSDDPEIAGRVMNDMMCFQVGWYLADDETRDYVADSGWLVMTDPDRFLRCFLASMTHEGNLWYAEGSRVEDSVLVPYELPKKSGNVPPEAEGLAENEWIEYTPDDIALRMQGSLSDLKPDKNAAAGKTCVLYSTSWEWIFEIGVTRLWNKLAAEGWKTCDIYFSARLEGETKDPEAPAMRLISWNPGYGFEYELKAKDMSHEYKTYKAATVDITRSTGSSLFAFAMKNPEACDAVCIDRVFIIPHKQGK